LRRTKQLLNLPDIVSEKRLLTFSAKEEYQYVHTRERLIKMVRQNNLRAKDRKGNLGVFQLQLQLRRLCNHGTFQKLSLDEEEFDPEQAITQLNAQKDARCENCKARINAISRGSLEQTRTGTFTICGHLICMKCVRAMNEKLQKAHGHGDCFRCSLCQEQIKGEYFLFDEGIAMKSKNVHRDLSPWQYFDKNGRSTKISTVIGDIERNETEGKR
jgi:SWI/SNF-related matrix-associated actin-dependent regulator of chromatin subfamily A3